MPEETGQDLFLPFCFWSSVGSHSTPSVNRSLQLVILGKQDPAATDHSQAQPASTLQPGPILICSGRGWNNSRELVRKESKKISSQDAALSVQSVECHDWRGQSNSNNQHSKHIIVCMIRELGH